MSGSFDFVVGVLPRSISISGVDENGTVDPMSIVYTSASCTTPTVWQIKVIFVERGEAS